MRHPITGKRGGLKIDKESNFGNVVIDLERKFFTQSSEWLSGRSRLLGATYYERQNKSETQEVRPYHAGLHLALVWDISLLMMPRPVEGRK
ncbi:MAG: hypothetical protein FJ118_08940 [Deltaproteobacteria bacterium]|nr:hypothetical protein [Deltaproteobacteria bacterium]